MSENNLDNFMDSDLWKEYEKRMQEKKKFLKKGSDVVHLHYLGNLFSEEDFKLYEEKLHDVNLQFSRYDQQGDIKDSHDLYELKIFLAVTTPIIYELLKGIGINSVWEVIKFLLVSGWKRTRNKFGYKLQGDTPEKHKINFGLKVALNKHTTFNFHMDGNLDEKTVLNSLDKILEFLKEQDLKEKYHLPGYVYFDENKDEWIKIDVMEEHLKNMRKKSDDS
jgi:hypothetical protein